MATINNLRIYEQAEKGKRVFIVPAAAVHSVRVGLWRRGFRIKMRSRKGVVELVLSK